MLLTLSDFYMEDNGFVLVKSKKGRNRKNLKKADLVKNDVLAELSEDEIDVFIR